VIGLFRNTDVPQAEPRAPDTAAERYHLVAIAASAGGLTAVATLLSGLPSNFPLPIALVQHLAPAYKSAIAEILGRRTDLTVTEARTGDTLKRGVVYVAPPAQHLEIGSSAAILLTHGEPVHFVRPSADRLFESAARVLGPIIGIVLTGTGSDGTDGARAIRAAGGVVIAQDEASSAFFGMPHAAIDAGVVDRVMPLDRIAAALAELTETEPS
jgi:two-component system, chemotaxis family, protein-glutamate methylesterase/glutaminase